MQGNLRPGVHVQFTGEDGENLDGEILYSDENQNFFLLQRPAKSGRQDSHDVYFFRHNNVKDMRITKNANLVNYPELDLQKVSNRSSKNEKLEHERLKLFESDVPKKVRDLCEHLSKTLPGDDRLPVRWVKPDIHVLEQTIIKSPYYTDDVQPKNESGKAKSERDYVRKLVERFYSERGSDT